MVHTSHGPYQPWSISVITQNIASTLLTEKYTINYLWGMEYRLWGMEYRLWGMEYRVWGIGYGI